MSFRVSAIALSACVGCSPTAFHAPTAAASGPSALPLGPSYVLVPVPSDDDSLLGRVLPAAPEPGQSLEQIARPNPCHEHLTEPRESPLANHYEDAHEVAGSASVSATLGLFGLRAHASHASHFLYEIRTDRRVARTDTPEYVKCCKESGECGVGFVSALVHGTGEYATAEETAGSGSVTVASAGAEGGLSVRVLERRNVSGYIAALVTLTGDTKTDALGPLGAREFEPTVTERVQAAYERDKVTINELGDTEWVLATGQGPISENEFARRYAAKTGSSELEPVDQRRNMTAVLVTGALTAGALYLTYWGITNLETPCSADELGCTHYISSGDPQPTGTKCTARDESGFCEEYVDPNEGQTNALGIVGVTVGATLSLAIGGAFIGTLVFGDGWPNDHVLSPEDARRYVTRYNRAALRNAKAKIRREVTIEEQAGVELQPILGPISGVLGRF